MISKCEKYIIIYNGEIYNFNELKKKLPRAINNSLNSNSDTEVLLYSLIHNGIENTCKFIDGMFSFAFLKIKEQKLYLARDKFGEKPLYYSISDNGISFGSTVACLKEYSNQNLIMDKKSISYYLRYGYINSSESIYEDIKQVSV